MISHYHRIALAGALALALIAGAAPAAWGDPAPLAQAESTIANAPTRALASGASCGDVCSGHGYGSVDVITVGSSRPHSGATGGDFDWGDAGIGAGSAFLLVVVGLGGARAASSGRRRHAQRQRVVATG